MSVKVAGLDLSMTASGVCHIGDDTDLECQTGVCWHLIKPRKDKDLRLPEIKSRIKQLVTGHEFVLLEMLPPHMKAAGITGMVQGVVREMLLEQGSRYGDVGPSSLKKYATGKGNASKTEMALAALKRGGLEFSNDNECDAWWLWVMAMDFSGCSVFSLPQTQRAELQKIEMKG